MKHLKGIWQLWGKYFMALMRKTGLQMIIGSLFFSLGAGFVMSKSTTDPAIFSDNAAAIFALIAACALCMGMAELAADVVNDDKAAETGPSKLEHVLKEKEAA